MKFLISENILQLTTKYENNFSCINGEGENMCKIKLCVNEEVHFINSKPGKICSYKMNFGNKEFCSCPTRKEIYNKYFI